MGLLGRAATTCLVNIDVQLLKQNKKQWRQIAWGSGRPPPPVRDRRRGRAGIRGDGDPLHLAPPGFVSCHNRIGVYVCVRPATP